MVNNLPAQMICNCHHEGYLGSLFASKRIKNYFRSCCEFKKIVDQDMEGCFYPDSWGLHFLCLNLFNLKF